MNYRCAVVVGRAISVDDDAEKATALRAIVEHALAGRSDDCRGPNASELRSTRVIKVAIDEASAKVRTGPPIDDEEDLSLPYWAGEIPFVTTLGPPLADEYVPAGIATPTYDR
jgi:hypothetical protein